MMREDDAVNASARHDPLTTLLTERDVLVLSPHMDDAMLSASTVVLEWPAEVWTVFTGRPVPPQTTSWDLSCGFADSDATISARVLEDDAAFAGLKATNRRLGYLEGAYATRENHRRAIEDIERSLDAWMAGHPDGLVIAPVCAGRHMPPAPWEGLLGRVQRLASRLRSSVAPSRAVAPEPSSREALPDPGPTEASFAGPTSATAQALPLRRAARHLVNVPKSIAQRALHAEYLHRRAKAMGGGLAANPDHVALRDVTLNVTARHPSIRLALYEDFPYLWHARGDDEAQRSAASRGLALHRTALPVDIARKYGRLRRYASQLPVLDPPGRLLDGGQIPDEEVYWLVEEMSASPRPGC